MAVLTEQLRRRYGPLAGAIPVPVREAIDQGELLDRLEAASALVRKAEAAATFVLRTGYAQQARDLLMAQPREATETQVRDLLQKAAGASSRRVADAYRAQAERLRAAHPAAPRRPGSAPTGPVLKATLPPGTVAVYNKAGDLVGIAKASDIRPVVEPRPTQVAKARKARAARPSTAQRKR
jgi:hypothetical protein